MKKILLFMLLAVAMLFGATKPMEVEAKTTTITVKKADTSTAKKLHKQLKKKAKFTIKVKGNKTKSKKLLENVNKKLQTVNSYSVKMNYKRKKTSKGYTYYEVSKDNAKLYCYTIQLLTKMYTEPCIDSVVVGKEMVEVKDHDYDISYNTHLEEKKTFYSGNFKNHPNYGGKKFCNLSSLQQANVVGAYLTPLYNPEGERDYYIWNNSSKSTLMKRLLSKTARMRCWEITEYQRLIFDQIGITSYYAESKQADHAVAVIKCSNSAGKIMYLVSNNGNFPLSYKCYTENWKRVDGVTDWKISASSKINKDVYNCKFTADDIRECLEDIEDVNYIDFP